MAHATRIALDMQRTLGLGEEYLLLYRANSNPADALDRDPRLAARIHGRLEAALESATTILREGRDLLDAMIRVLFDAQALDGWQVMLILGRR